MTETYIYKKINSIIFGMLSPAIIKKMSVAKIVTPELYDREGYPVDGGLMDVRLGVIDPGLRCKTCGGNLRDCMGHFGYLDLARPVIHLKYADIILGVLRCTCKDCGKLLTENKSKLTVNDEEVSEETADVEISTQKQARSIRSSLKNVKKCPHCGAKQENIKLERPTTFLEGDKRLSAIDIRIRLERVSEKDIAFLGLNPEYARPEWGVLTILPVPPVTIRPSITLETGERSEDDLTHKLGDIVRINQRLFENINAGAPEIIIEDLWDLLQYHLTTYFDNEVSQIPPARHRSGQALRTLTERIKSKEGRFRHNLAGKRVNYAARTVISPDSKMELNEVGVPLIIAMELTVPEKVTEWNLKRLKKFVENGPKKYPGSNYVVRPDGKKKKITDETHEQLLEELQPGYVVERHLMDGDIVIFNRQPSLHRMSIMCHRVKVLPGRSFRLNPSVCVAPDTLVQLSTGIQRPIHELRNCWKESELSTFDRKNQKVFATELKKFWALKPEEYEAKCYEVITKETGRKIIATGDHPFYTFSGVKAAHDLVSGTKVILRPLDTPIYQEIERTIITEEDIKKVAPKETYLKHSIKTLSELKLLPLNLIDQRCMIFARLLGHLFGDGTFILKGDNARLIFRGEVEDLETIRGDIENLGFNPEKIYIKTAGGEIVTVKGKKLKVYGSYPCFEIRNKPLALLFAALGAPNGDKVKLSYSVPKWIENAPMYIKREFIASYFGAEMTSPAIREKSKSNFRTLVFKLSKIEQNKIAAYKFINSLTKCLKDFNVKVSGICEEEGNIRKDGMATRSFAANISDDRSIMNLLGRIGYIYSKRKDNIARLAYQYLLLKDKEINSRQDKYSQFLNLRKKNYKFSDISKKLNVQVGILENWSYRYKNAGLPSNYPGFFEWIKQNSAGPGLVYETVEKIKETYCPFVYDITTVADTHNFFANNFLTKNCNPYNADFDGDEMNLHVPQTEEARAEAEILMEVQIHIITPKNGLNVIGCSDDAVTGNYILTKNLKFEKPDAIQLLHSVGVFRPDRFEKFKKIVDGREIFSAVLPDDFDFIGHSKSKEAVVIKKGFLAEGVIDKATIGKDKGDLIRGVYAKYGSKIGLDILGKIFRLGIGVLLRHGFTTSVSDTDLPKDISDKCRETIYNSERRASQLIEQYKSKQLDALPGLSLIDTVEIKIMEVLNKARQRVGEIIAEADLEVNSTILMANSGAKGSSTNLSMMAACIGQQALRGKRIDIGYRGRTLCIFQKNDLSPRAKGFVKRGYKDGLSPEEYFMHAMTGRDSLMDTALRTPKSGYLYRRLSSALQDIKVEYDYTVRDAEQNIVQFLYGEDGLDVSRTEGGKINVARIIREVLS